jgi:hypothetical protein
MTTTLKITEIRPSIPPTKEKMKADFVAKEYKVIDRSSPEWYELVPEAIRHLSDKFQVPFAAIGTSRKVVVAVPVKGIGGLINACHRAGWEFDAYT